MNKSESIKELAAALAKAQGQMEGAKKDSDNPFFKSKYADLASVWEACRVALSENGLSVLQAPTSTERGVSVETVLMHSSGEWISETLTIPVTKADAQGFGSALAYCRRYGLAPMVGVCAEDDDGNAAALSTAKQQKDTGKALLLANVKPTIPPDEWTNKEFEKVRLAVELIASAIEKGLHKEAHTAYMGYETDERVAIYKALDKEQRKAIREVQKEIDLEAIRKIPGGPAIVDVEERIKADDLDMAADLARDITDPQEKEKAEELILAANRRKQKSLV